MKIDVEALTFPLTLAQRSYVERRLALSLGVYAAHIEAVEVWLSEFRVVGEDYRKRCLIWIELEGGRMVVSESTDPDLRVAIYRAADQASWKLSRSILRRAPGHGRAGEAETLPADGRLNAA